MKTIKKLEKEIEECKKVRSIFREQPDVRGGMTNSPNVEDVKKWHKWYKEKYERVRKHPLNSEELQATLTQTNEIIKLIEEIFKKKRWLWIGEDDEINWDKSIIELEEELQTKIKGDGE